MTSPQHPTVSVVIPVYNGEQTIENCLTSVLALEYPKDLLEIIVVDNASTDGTLEVLKRYGDKLVVLEEKARGRSAARNCGIAAARNEIVAFTDADCRVDEQWVRHLVVPLADEKIGIAGGRILAKRPHNRIEAFGDKIHDHEKAMTAYKLHYAITMNWASRASVLKKHPFDQRFVRSEDVDLAYRLQQAGYKLAYAGEAIIYHANESTFPSLFREGCKHGFWEVHLAKAHNDYRAAAGHRRFYWSNYRRLLTSLRRAVTGPDRTDARCDFTFNFGKKLGKWCGSVRFRHIEL